MLLEVLLTLSKYLSFLSSFAFVGLLLAMSLLTVNTEGNFSANSLALRRKASLIGLLLLILYLHNRHPCRHFGC
jgi:hypothetical protein